jgi:DNA-binding transcriptional ArsR family regulator
VKVENRSIPKEAQRDGAPARTTEAILRFIERYASDLADAGMARMPARVFVALQVTDTGRLTAAELAELLQVSPGAISGAVRYLGQLNLVSREREPGSRRDHYRVHDDAWYESLVRRDRLLERWEASVREGLAVVGADTPAGERLAETLAFYEFSREEIPGMLGRWRERRAQLRRDGS